MVIVGVSSLALSILSTTITNNNYVLAQSLATSNSNQTSAFIEAITLDTKNDSEGLSYDTQNMSHRSAIEEW